jgi:tetratricopeptide (TPR) repeat protein
MNRTALLLAISSVATSAFAQMSPEDFGPHAVVRQLLPETLPKPDAPAYFGELEKAQSLLFHGHYRSALYASFALGEAEPIDVALVRGEAYWRIGQTELARQTLSPFAGQERADLLLAEIDRSEGLYDAAIARLKTVLSGSPESVGAKHSLANMYELKGDLESAIAIDKTFAEGADSVLAKFKSEGALGFESAEDLTLAAESIDRWAAVTQAYSKDVSLHDTVLEMFVAAYDTVDREYWPARLAAARYLASHGNAKDAGAELDEANKANPNDPRVNLLLGELQQENPAMLRAAVDALRDVDPNSFDADLVEVSASLRQRQFKRALKLAQRCVERQPQNLDALAMLAATYAARGEAMELAQALAKVDAIDPDNASARVQVAGMLGTAMYDTGGAVTQLRVAVDRAPWWTAPRHALGIALIQEGEELEARSVLDKAHEVDPYNVKTVNYLRVLDELAKFKEFESEHFIFRYDEVDDPIVPLYIAPQMDAMYEDQTSRFAFKPEKKPIIEIFPDAQSFSVRTAGMPGLETYGASLGRVMTTVAPRAGETLGPFNWSRVLRHEFTHTLNLMYTHGRVPRWLTEGLAVWTERVPFRFPNVPEMMYDRAMKDDMPSARTMITKFEGEFGYMSGFWIVRFIDENYGWENVRTLITAYREGKEDDDAFLAATGMNVDQFHEKFAAWSKEQVKGWGYDEATKKTVKALEKEAEMLTQAAQYEKAAENWREIHKLQPMNPLPNRRLAGIHLREKNVEAALPYLIATLPLELQDNRFAKRIARAYETMGEASKAMEFANVAIGINPYDPDVHVLLADLHEKAAEKEKAAQEREMAKLLDQRAEKAAAK